MKIGQIDSKQSFQALNMSNVCRSDLIYVRKDFNKLMQLGEKYNIRLTSTYSDIPGYSAIDIDVKPLNKNLSFWRKIFPPMGKSTFKTGYTYIDEPVKTSVLDSVYEAINNLKSKIG